MVLATTVFVAGIGGWWIGDASAILRYSLFPMVTICGVLLGWLRASGIAMAGVCLLLCISTAEYRSAGSAGRLDLMMWAASVGVTGAIAGLYARNKERHFKRRVSDLRRLAETDPLTSLPNRRVLLRAIENEFKAGIQESTHCHLLLVDVDRFKSFNDRYGHDVGDDVLRKVARAISCSIRHHDLAARYGGEEFAILLPDTSREGAHRVAERLRASVEALKVKVGPNTVSVTISIGGSDITEVSTAAELLEFSDARLYAAKAAGRNLVRFTGHARDETRIRATSECAELAFVKSTAECRFEDALTGLPSYQVFAAELRRRIMEFRRYGSPFSIAICRLEAGDQPSQLAFENAMMNVIMTMRRGVRETDLMSWISSQEIGVLLPQTTRKQALVPVKRVLESIVETGETEGPDNRFCIRVAEAIGDDTGEALLKRCRESQPEAVVFAATSECNAVNSFTDSCVPA